MNLPESAITIPGTAASLGVNIDHIATLRQLRGTPYPSVLEAARLVESAGGRQVTVHLREDRRHIQDDDVRILRRELRIPLNLEMAATDAMVRFAKKIRPDWACLVPEKRQELTTEGGLALGKNRKRIAQAITGLRKSGIRVSLFVEPSVEAVRLSHELGADAVELHTGRYCLETQKSKSSAKGVASQLERIRKAGIEGHRLGLAVHAGHGFDYANVRAVAQLGSARAQRPELPLISEFNIGHAIVSRAALVGLERAVREMVSAIAAP